MPALISGQPSHSQASGGEISQLGNDIGAHTLVGEDFQQDGMGHAAIEGRDLLHARLDCGHAAVQTGACYKRPNCGDMVQVTRPPG